MNASCFSIAVVLLVTVTPGVANAQEARIANAHVQTQSVPSGLSKAFGSLVKNRDEPAWIGYAVPIVEGNHHICCYSSEEWRKPAAVRRGRCKLEGRDQGMNFQTNRDDDEQRRPNSLLVLFRVAQRNVGKIRVFTDDCEIDAGGLPVYWLTDVRSTESIDLLASFVTDSGEETKATRKERESAIAAIALHADAAADRALEKLVDPKHSKETRKDTAFWLGNLRGRKGYGILRQMIRQDPSDEVREQCVFALSISKVKEAVNAMIDAARADKSPRVRGQALFWLSQKAGEKVTKAIADAVQSDPETGVKKKAVFALSQLPNGEGVPKLIQVARTNRNKEVRKDAIFWLGESKDPRALAFFEDVLTH